MHSLLVINLCLAAFFSGELLAKTESLKSLEAKLRNEQQQLHKQVILDEKLYFQEQHLRLKLRKLPLERLQLRREKRLLSAAKDAADQARTNANGAEASLHLTKAEQVTEKVFVQIKERELRYQKHRVKEILRSKARLEERVRRYKESAARVNKRIARARAKARRAAVKEAHKQKFLKAEIQRLQAELYGIVGDKVRHARSVVASLTRHLQANLAKRTEGLREARIKERQLSQKFNQQKLIVRHMLGRLSKMTSELTRKAKMLSLEDKRLAHAKWKLREYKVTAERESKARLAENGKLGKELMHLVANMKKLSEEFVAKEKKGHEELKTLNHKKTQLAKELSRELINEKHVLVKLSSARALLKASSARHVREVSHEKKVLRTLEDMLSSTVLAGRRKYHEFRRRMRHYHHMLRSLRLREKASLKSLNHDTILLRRASSQLKLMRATTARNVAAARIRVPALYKKDLHMKAVLATMEKHLADAKRQAATLSTELRRANAMAARESEKLSMAAHQYVQALRHNAQLNIKTTLAVQRTKRKVALLIDELKRTNTLLKQSLVNGSAQELKWALKLAMLHIILRHKVHDLEAEKAKTARIGAKTRELSKKLAMKALEIKREATKLENEESVYAKVRTDIQEKIAHDRRHSVRAKAKAARELRAEDSKYSLALKLELSKAKRQISNLKAKKDNLLHQMQIERAKTARELRQLHAESERATQLFKIRLRRGLHMKRAEREKNLLWREKVVIAINKLRNTRAKEKQLSQLLRNKMALLAKYKKAELKREEQLNSTLANEKVKEIHLVNRGRQEDALQSRQRAHDEAFVKQLKMQISVKLKGLAGLKMKLLAEKAKASRALHLEEVKEHDLFQRMISKKKHAQKALADLVQESKHVRAVRAELQTLRELWVKKTTALRRVTAKYALLLKRRKVEHAQDIAALAKERAREMSEAKHNEVESSILSRRVVKEQGVLARVRKALARAKTNKLRKEEEERRRIMREQKAVDSAEKRRLHRKEVAAESRLFRRIRNKKANLVARLKMMEKELAYVKAEELKEADHQKIRLAQEHKAGSDQQAKDTASLRRERAVLEKKLSSNRAALKDLNRVTASIAHGMRIEKGLKVALQKTKKKQRVVSTRNEALERHLVAVKVVDAKLRALLKKLHYVHMTAHEKQKELSTYKKTIAKHQVLSRELITKSAEVKKELAKHKKWKHKFLVKKYHTEHLLHRWKAYIKAYQTQLSRGKRESANFILDENRRSRRLLNRLNTVKAELKSAFSHQKAVVFLLKKERSKSVEEVRRRKRLAMKHARALRHEKMMTSSKMRRVDDKEAGLLKKIAEKVQTLKNYVEQLEKIKMDIAHLRSLRFGELQKLLRAKAEADDRLRKALEEELALAFQMKHVAEIGAQTLVRQRARGRHELKAENRKESREILELALKARNLSKMLQHKDSEDMHAIAAKKAEVVQEVRKEKILHARELEKAMVMLTHSKHALKHEMEEGLRSLQQERDADADKLRKAKANEVKDLNNGLHLYAKIAEAKVEAFQALKAEKRREAQKLKIEEEMEVKALKKAAAKVARLTIRLKQQIASAIHALEVLREHGVHEYEKKKAEEERNLKKEIIKEAHLSRELAVEKVKAALALRTDKIKDAGIAKKQKVLETKELTSEFAKERELLHKLQQQRPKTSREIKRLNEEEARALQDFHNKIVEARWESQIAFKGKQDEEKEVAEETRRVLMELNRTRQQERWVSRMFMRMKTAVADKNKAIQTVSKALTKTRAEFKQLRAEVPKLKLLKARQSQGMARAHASSALLLHKIHELKAAGAEQVKHYHAALLQVTRHLQHEDAKRRELSEDGLIYELILSRLRHHVLKEVAKMKMVTLALRREMTKKAKLSKYLAEKKIALQLLLGSSHGGALKMKAEELRETLERKAHAMKRNGKIKRNALAKQHQLAKLAIELKKLKDTEAHQKSRLAAKQTYETKMLLEAKRQRRALMRAIRQERAEHMRDLHFEHSEEVKMRHSGAEKVNLQRQLKKAKQTLQRLNQSVNRKTEDKKLNVQDSSEARDFAKRISILKQKVAMLNKALREAYMSRKKTIWKGSSS